MILTNLDGETFKLSFSKNKNKKRRSKLCEEAILLLQRIFPTLTPLEEISIPVDSKTTLYFDIFFPMLKLVVEVNGQQHSEFNSFFHADKLAFLKQQKNDRAKKEFCELNNIKLIELDYNERGTWESKIRES